MGDEIRSKRKYKVATDIDVQDGEIWVDRVEKFEGAGDVLCEIDVLVTEFIE